MGSKFINKHKRKGALASLLLILRHRAKYFVISLLVVGTATPFIATRENISTLMQFAPVASFLKFTGLSNAFLNVNSDGSYSAKDLKAAFARNKAYDKGSSFWKKLLNKMSSNTPGDHSSIVMLRGADIFKDGDDSDEKGSGEGADDSNAGKASHNINAENLVPDVAGMMKKNGMLGDIMVSNLANRHGCGASPYMNKSLMAMNGGADDKYAGKYDDTIDEAGKYIPLVGKVKKARKMGKASGFAWKNAGYRSQKNNMNIRIKSNKRAMFQLAEAYAMTDSALTSDSAPEYQSSYVGSTYDGNDINADLLETDDGGSTEVPDTGFTGDLLTGIADRQEVAQECTEAQANEGAEMSRLAKAIDDHALGMGGAPKCYAHGAVDNWNNKVDEGKALCVEFNANAAVLSAKCQGEDQQMNCSSTYDGQKINKCPKPSKWLMWVIPFALLIMAIIAAVFGMPWLSAILLMVAAYSFMSSGGAGGGSGVDSQNTTLSDDSVKGGFDSNKTDDAN